MPAIFERGRYRFRTWLRGRLPSRLSWLAPKGRKDCGDHEVYRAESYEQSGITIFRCYHCEPFVWRSRKPTDDDVERARAIARREGWLTDNGFVWENEEPHV